MRPKFSMRRALKDPALLGSDLARESWRLWRVMLIAAMGESLSPSERKLFAKFTGREREPGQRVQEACFVVGRRGGKDRAAAALAVYLASLCDHCAVLAPGERGLVLCLGADQRQAKITFDYIEAAFTDSPLLAQLLAKRTNDTLELKNRITIEVRAASFRRLRGVTAVAVIASEVAFWMDQETSTNPDTEILNAVRPALATTGGPLILISSPYARKGVLWDIYEKDFGPTGDPLILVAHGASRDFNSTLSQQVVDRALERDPAAARAEYLAEWRTDVETFVAREAVDACVSHGILERAPSGDPNTFYKAFCDPSGGSKDSMTLAIAHRQDDRAVLDVIREVRAPFSPESVVREFSDVLTLYGLNRLSGDKYAGEWPREQFMRFGIRYVPAEKTKSDLYLDLLPAINSRLVDLLDHNRLLAQLVGLERKTGRGKDVIDHPKHAHDDVANAAAGALNLVLNRKRWEVTPMETGLPIV